MRQGHLHAIPAATIRQKRSLMFTATTACAPGASSTATGAPRDATALVAPHVVLAAPLPAQAVRSCQSLIDMMHTRIVSVEATTGGNHRTVGYSTSCTAAMHIVAAANSKQITCNVCRGYKPGRQVLMPTTATVGRGAA